MVGKRAVRILLECFLVDGCFDKVSVVLHKSNVAVDEDVGSVE